jgi:molybdate/tungstate transport system substrate-binding protein
MWLGTLTACAAGPTPTAAPPRRTLRVFCAGSLIVPFAELERAFEAQHPDVDVQNECHGSIQVIRHVTELHEAIDIVATADHALIPLLMYAANDQDGGRPFANWYLRFAGGRLGLAYTPTSHGASEINAANWPEILARPEVKFGLADPRFDAAGYRSLMILSLAERTLDASGLWNSLIRDAFTFPITRFRDEGRTEISVPEVLEPAADSRVTLRGGSIQLLALLEAGEIDYAFEYESVIAQHRLEQVHLPETLNLGAAAHAAAYAQVQVELDFQRFASVRPIFRGEPIGYGITIPATAPEPELAQDYLAFLLGPEGRAVMAAAQQPLLTAVICDQAAVMPNRLSAFCTPTP